MQDRDLFGFKKCSFNKRMPYYYSVGFPPFNCSSQSTVIVKEKRFRI